MPIHGKQIKFEQPPMGLNHAVIAGVWDIGTQVFNWQGKTSENPQIVIMMELAAKMTEGENAGKPFQAAKFENLYMSKNARLRKDIESIVGKKFSSDDEAAIFDVESLVGMNVFINLMEDGDKFKIDSFAKPPAGTPNMRATLTTMPDWVAKKRAASLEESALSNGNAKSNNPEDSLPF